MFGLKLPVLAAAGVLGVVAVGGVTGLPQQALADDGGGGTSASAPESSGSVADPSGSSEPTDYPEPSEYPAPPAPPGSASAMDVSPSTVAPGGTVSLHLKASCKAGDKAKASAEVFVDAVTLSPAGDGSGGWVSSAEKNARRRHRGPRRRRIAD